MADSLIVNTSLKPAKGQLTFDHEGAEGGKWHSRKLHVPSDASGLTIGRGYDMKNRTENQILTDLTLCGVSQEDAKKVSKAASLSGAAARKFITDNKLESFEIDSATQVKLFDISYAREAKEVDRLSSKDDVVEAYGSVDWTKTDPAIRELVIDLKFRGDYDGRARRLIQKHIVDNDVEALAKVMGESGNWKNVPKDRFDARKKFIQDAAQKKKLVPIMRLTGRYLPV